MAVLLQKDPIESLTRRRRPHNHHSHVIQALGTEIVSGHFGEGTSLPQEADLFDRFGISRTVLREALKTLAAKGLIEQRARIGTKVLPRARWNLFDPDVLTWHLEAGIDEAFLTNLAEIRLAMEPEAAALAARNRTPENIEVLRHWTERMGQLGQTTEGFALNDYHFHLAVAEASKNPFMVSMSAVIEAALIAVFTISSPVNSLEEFARGVTVHTEIAEAIIAGDAEAARKAMRQAIGNGIERATAALANR